MRDLDPFRPAGGARGVDDVGEALASAAEAGSEPAPGIPRQASLTRRGEPSIVPGLGQRGAIQEQHARPFARPAWACTRAAASSTEHAALPGDELQPLLRVGGIERQVGAAREEHRQRRDHQLRRAFEAQPHRLCRAHSQRAQLDRQPRGAGEQLAVADLSAAPADGQRVGSERRSGGHLPAIPIAGSIPPGGSWRSRGRRRSSRWRLRSPGTSPAARRSASVSFHSRSDLVPLGRREQRQLGSRRPGSAMAAPSKVSRCPASRSTVAASKSSVLYASIAAASPPPSQTVAARGRTARCVASTRGARASSPGSSMRPTGAFCSAQTTWKSGVTARCRSGRSSSTRRSKGRSWWAKASSVLRAHAGEQLAEGRVAARGRRACTSVLTKKPISPSISRPVAVRDRRAHGQVLLAGERARAGPGSRRAAP